MQAISEASGAAPAEADARGAVPAGATLCVTKGFYEGLERPLDRNWMVIGRGRSADIMIAEPTISRAHAVIGFEDGEFFVQDLGSTNGTRVNGERTSRQTLANGDEVLLGKLSLRVSLPAADPS